MTLLEAIASLARSSPGEPAVTFHERARPVARATRGELLAAVERVAGALAARIQPGDRVLLPFPQGIDVLTAFLGTLAAGGVAVPTEAPGRTASLERFERLIDDAAPSLILTPASTRENIGKRLAGRATPLVAFEELGTSASPVSLRVPGEDDLAFLQYTSGSTSSPRGVRITHANLMANLAMIHACFRAREHEVVVTWLPFFHDMGLIGMMLLALRHGYPLHLMSPLDFMKNPRWWLEVISTERGTITAAPNFAFDICVTKVKEDQRAGLDLSSLRVLVNGAETVRLETVERFERAFGSCGLDPAAMTPSYGLAEATLAVSSGPVPAARPTVPAPTGAPGRLLIGNGHPAPGVDVGFLIGDDIRQGEDEVGEIVVHAASVSPGYWAAPGKEPEDPSVSVAGKRWLRTGDLGFMKQGEIFVTGRVKDVIIVNGRNLHPGDVEETCRLALGADPPEAVAAVGIDRGDGEHVAVFLEISRDAVDEERFAELAARVRSACMTNLGVQVPEVVFVPPRRLPRTTSGKIRRRALRDTHQMEPIPSLSRQVLRPREPRAPPEEPAPARRSFPAIMRRFIRMVAEVIQRPGSGMKIKEFGDFPEMRTAIRERWLRWDYMRRQLGMRVKDPRRAFLVHALAAFPVPRFDRERRWRVIDDPLEDLAAWIDFRGLEPARERHRGGERVVLVGSHIGAPNLAPLLLARLGTPVASVALPALTDRDFSKIPALTPVEVHEKSPARSVVECRRALDRGSMIHIVADGYMGKLDVVVPFHGRERGFASGFASIARAAGALAIPVFSIVDRRGRIRFELAPPLEADSAPGLVRAYAAILERYWRRRPANVDFHQMKALVFPP